MIYSTENNLIRRDRRAIILWLSICTLLVVCMVAVGGYTRLSGAGLSITQWKLVHGVVPPLDEAQWEEEFAGYKQSPQYQKINKGMSVEEFKNIFWPEYFHRLLGRAIGFAFLFPFLIFLCRRSFTKRFGWRLLGIFALGGMQGAIGWIMVASGLVNQPYVNPLKLALHLIVAFAIFGLLLWAISDAGCQMPDAGKKKVLATGNRQLATYFLWFALLILQLILGALVAGNHAGLIYNTWPTMNGRWLPENFSDTLALIQFLHRKLAIILVLGFLFWWIAQREYVKNRRLGWHCLAVAAVLAVQFVLGVLTLVNAVPLPLALSHQLVALLLFAASVLLIHKLKS